MKSDEQTKFLKWYDDHVSENYVFDFQKEIIEYCQSDVDILRRGMMKLREDFIQLENIDPLRYITIASVCMTIYTEKYIFYDFECTQNTGTHTVNLSIAQDFEGNEYVHNSIEEFFKTFINEKYN